MLATLLLTSFSLLAFLFPLTIYLLVLAMINRRFRPTMVWGVWDGVGLLAASSGFLLLSVPAILWNQFEPNILIPAAIAGNEADFEFLLARWYGIWAGYYLLLILGSAWFLWSRRRRTIVYNVDPDLFALTFTRCVETLDLAQARIAGNVHLGPLETPASMPRPVSVASDNPTPSGQAGNESVQQLPLAPPLRRTLPPAEVRIDDFAPLCNVTLHWVHTSPAIRHEVEQELRKHLETCTAQDNPAGSWLLGIGTFFVGVNFLIIGFLFLIVFRVR